MRSMRSWIVYVMPVLFLTQLGGPPLLEPKIGNSKQGDDKDRLRDQENPFSVRMSHMSLGSDGRSGQGGVTTLWLGRPDLLLLRRWSPGSAARRRSYDGHSAGAC